jgi:hypothetical protein
MCIDPEPPVRVTATLFGPGMPLLQVSVPVIEPAAAEQLISAEPPRLRVTTPDPALLLHEPEPLIVTWTVCGTAVTRGWKPALALATKLQVPTKLTDAVPLSA